MMTLTQNSTVKGLIVNRWKNTGIVISGSGATGNRVRSNFISTDATGTTTVRARLDSTPNATFTVQFFSNPAGTEEGKKLIGQKSVTTDANGDAAFTFTTKQKVSVGQAITATATGTFGTSEFSTPKQVVAS